MSPTPSQGSSDQVGKHAIEFQDVSFGLAVAVMSETDLIAFAPNPISRRV